MDKKQHLTQKSDGSYAVQEADGRWSGTLPGKDKSAPPKNSDSTVSAENLSADLEDTERSQFNLSLNELWISCDSCARIVRKLSNGEPVPHDC